jgi:hypothetical protein
MRDELRQFRENITVLKTEGFFEIPDRELWASRERRMAFGHVSLRDNGRQWLRDSLDEQPDAGEFVFHFLTVPADPHGSEAKELSQNCYQVLEEIGLANLRPSVRYATFRSKRN